MATMTQLSRQYVQALSRALTSPNVDETIAVKNLVAHLRTKGRIKLLPGILRELRARQVYARKQAPQVEVAREADSKEAFTGAATLGVSVASATVNPALIRGWRARAAGTLVDHSAKRALIELYRTIIR